ncbi:MAG: extracellular solute-binding protein [Ruminococcaceae bacterium]|nr:extracellular solute-binding protein [Oscillospiraceae bacterium]
MTKRIITLLLCVAMLLSVACLAGCGDEKGGNNGANNGISAADEEEFFLDVPSELRGSTVQFATWIDHTKTDTAICLAGFEEATGIKAELVQVNESDYIQKVTALIAADQSPDVVVENGSFPKTLNLLMPLEVETTGLDVKDPFWNQGTVERFTIGDYSYLVNGVNSSWDMAGAMTYFNKTILEENGITSPAELVEQNNWNVDSMWTLMEQIKGACGFSRPGTSITFEDWVNMYGGAQIRWDPKTDKFVNSLKEENTKKAIDYMMRAQDAGLARIIANHDDDISKGNIALQICGAYGLRKSPGWFYTMDVDDLGFAPLPKVNKDDADYPYNSSIRAYGLCKGCKNPKGGAYFLRYFLNEDHYDVNQIFKNEEAKKMYMELREKQNYDKIFLTWGVVRVSEPTGDSLTMVNPLIKGTSAQVSVNLEKAFNSCESYVAAANKIIEDVIAEQ